MDRDLIKRIKNAPKNLLPRLLRDYGVVLAERGNSRCLQPEHHNSGDVHASMTYYSNDNHLYCHGCRYWADPATIVRHFEKCDAAEAITILARRAGLAVPPNLLSRIKSSCRKNGRFRPAPTFRSPEPVMPSRKVLACLSCLAERACSTLHNDPDAESVLSYLTDVRGLSLETVKISRLGAVTSLEGLYRGLTDAGHSKETIKEAGLRSFRHYSNSGSAFVVIPYLAPSSSVSSCVEGCPVVCVKAHLPNSSSKGSFAKYLCSASRVPVLYNAQALEAADTVLVAEGEFDTLTLVSHGYAAVGVPGAKSFKSEWVPLFKGKTVTLVFDGDDAGREGAENLSRLLASVAKKVSIASLPEGSDVNSFFGGTNV